MGVSTDGSICFGVLSALAAAAEANPRDGLTISALADKIEELGGDPAQLRALTIDGPMVLVLTCNEEQTEQRQINEIHDSVRGLIKDIHRNFNFPIWFICLPHGMTFRAIRLTAAEVAAAAQKADNSGEFQLSTVDS